MATYMLSTAKNGSFTITSGFNSFFSENDNFQLSNENVIGELIRTDQIADTFFEVSSRSKGPSATIRTAGRVANHLRRGRMRSIEQINNWLDLKGALQERVLILGEQLSVPVEMQLDDQHFFFVELKYTKDGQSKRRFTRLDHDGRHLQFSKVQLYKDWEGLSPEEVAEQIEFSEHILYYRTEAEGKKKDIKVTPFTPIFPDQQALLDEVAGLRENIPERIPDEKSLKSIVLLHWNLSRGYTTAEALEEWWEAHIAIEEPED